MDLDYCIICGKPTTGNLYCSRECHLQDCPGCGSTSEQCSYSKSADLHMLSSQYLDHFRRRSSMPSPSTSSSLLNGFVASRLAVL
ncbi:Extender-the chronological lifespan protein Ecl2 [Schizosaccharomyces pombe]|uniref:Extender of the chronological lifespan protein 2 n=1 Tax=Schizosaccharomyces pombe (strain 972 / ATCC 24843) TaxID=284812 RepID=ECL2_SCHPO|nr:protein Ecl2 [Schizosaccharomyces pombe]C6Y4C5.1 RecName: Full=Extender of the chronological lifespan protein 2 [Schizosaccharomyces pombe 972h-]CBA11508.1 extender of the chronological lifespan protein Ecl2 [Schizosaccharomyces pombe]|eukprot:NP_001343083.1 protein Ecl2 [Schizosaccharomyces pombe]